MTNLLPNWLMGEVLTNVETVDVLFGIHTAEYHGNGLVRVQGLHKIIGLL